MLAAVLGVPLPCDTVGLSGVPPPEEAPGCVDVIVVCRGAFGERVDSPLSRRALPVGGGSLRHRLKSESLDVMSVLASSVPAIRCRRTFRFLWPLIFCSTSTIFLR